MQAQQQDAERLFNKIQRLPPDKVAVVDDFVDFLESRSKENTLVNVAGKLSEHSLEKIWDNLEDAEYDKL